MGPREQAFKRKKSWIQVLSTAFVVALVGALIMSGHISSENPVQGLPFGVILLVSLSVVFTTLDNRQAQIHQEESRGDQPGQ